MVKFQYNFKQSKKTNNYIHTLFISNIPLNIKNKKYTYFIFTLLDLTYNMQCLVLILI